LEISLIAIKKRGTAENFALWNTIFDCEGRGGYILDSDHERSVVKEALK